MADLARVLARLRELHAELVIALGVQERARLAMKKAHDERAGEDDDQESDSSDHDDDQESDSSDHDRAATKRPRTVRVRDEFDIHNDEVRPALAALWEIDRKIAPLLSEYNALTAAERASIRRLRKLERATELVRKDFTARLQADKERYGGLHAGQAEGTERTLISLVVEHREKAAALEARTEAAFVCELNASLGRIRTEDQFERDARRYDGRTPNFDLVPGYYSDWESA